jgi:hypothetical protein
MSFRSIGTPYRRNRAASRLSASPPSLQAATTTSSLVRSQSWSIDGISKSPSPVPVTFPSLSNNSPVRRAGEKTRGDHRCSTGWKSHVDAQTFPLRFALKLKEHRLFAFPCRRESLAITPASNSTQCQKASESRSREVAAHLRSCRLTLQSSSFLQGFQPRSPAPAQTGARLPKRSETSHPYTARKRYSGTMERQGSAGARTTACRLSHAPAKRVWHCTARLCSSCILGISARWWHCSVRHCRAPRWGQR